MRKFLFQFLILFSVTMWAQSGGSLDTSFNSPIANFNAQCPDLSGDVECIINQNDKYLVGGNISLNGCIQKSLIRINTNGTIDNTLNTGTGFQYININQNGYTFNGTIKTIFYDEQAQKIYVGGWFNRYNGVTSFTNGVPLRNIIRLNMDGTLDQSFIPTINYDISVTKILKLYDGKIIFCGGSQKLVWRLFSDGSEDTVFNNQVPNSTTFGGIPRGFVSDIAIQPSTGKILVGGNFTITSPESGNTPTPFIVINKAFVRLNADGSLDTNFNKPFMHNPYNYFQSINKIIVHRDESIYIQGDFDNCYGTPRNNYAKLKPNGELDTTYFNETGIFPLLTCIMQNDQKILFSHYDNSKGTETVKRLNTDGTLDTCFQSNFNTDSTINFITTLALQNDQTRILAGGHRFKVGQGLTARYSIARLKNSSIMTANDETFTAYNGASTTLPSVVLNDVLDGLTNPQNVFLSEVSNPTPGISFNTMSGQVTVASTVQSGNYILLYRICSNSVGCQACDVAAVNIIVTGFNPNIGPNHFVSSISIQEADKKIIVSGRFNKYNNIPKSKVARLNADLSLDDSFNIGTGIEGIPSDTVSIVRTTALQSLAGINYVLIGGTNMSKYNGQTLNAPLVRILPSGTKDNLFSPPNITANYYTFPSIENIKIDANNRIVICGNFTLTSGSNIRKNIARLNADGTLDLSFNYIHNGNTQNILENNFHSIVFQNNKILVGGAIRVINTHRGIIRLNDDGSLDTSFNSNIAFKLLYPSSQVEEIPSINEIGINPITGKLVIVGAFTSLNNQPISNNITLLDANGYLDTTFNTGATGFEMFGAQDPNLNKAYCNSITFLPDGNSFYVGGHYTKYNNQDINGICRILSNGTLDTTFSPGVGPASPFVIGLPNGIVNASKLHIDGKLLIGGHFRVYNQNTRMFITRLNPQIPGAEGKAANQDITDMNIGSGINIYPNPTTGILNIITDNLTKESFNVKIYNTLGQQVYNKEISASDNNQINIENLEKGSYFIILSNENRTVKKMILKK